jgi:hypothetical protein
MLISAPRYRDPVGASVAPRIGQGAFVGLRVTLRVWIDEPTPEFYCPALTVILQPRSIDEVKKTVEPDCDPWTEEDDRNPSTRAVAWSYPFVLGEGIWDFEVRLRQGKKERVFSGEGDRLRVTVH